MTQAQRTWALLGTDGTAYESLVPGTMGGNSASKVYGRLDCRSALAALRKGGYAKHRVFFADAQTARAAGFRPCGTCLRDEYREWKGRQPCPVWIRP